MEPLAACAADAGGEGELVVSGQPGKEPRRGVAETFAGIAPPAARAAKGIGASQPILAPFGAPTQFTSNVLPQFSLQHLLPTSASLVRKPHPGEMKQLMDQDAFKFAMAREHGGIQQDQTSLDGCARYVRSQRRANLHANRASHQLGQHNLFGGGGR